MTKIGKRSLAVLAAGAMFLTSFNMPFAETESEAAAQMTAQESTSAYGLSNPAVSDGVTTWDCIYFGNYWQEDTNGDGTADQNDEKQPIKWRVLSVDGDDAFLLADEALDCKSYNETAEEVTWETCTFREWLNGTFLDAAFSTEEQSAIKTTTVVNEDNISYAIVGGNTTSDKIFLLSQNEVINPNYGFNSVYNLDSETRQCKASAYAIENGCYIRNIEGYDDICWWWLRSPGYNSNGATSVDYGGWGNSIGHSVASRYGGVRPALNINLSSSSWEYAGTVSVNNNSTSTAAPSFPPTLTPLPSSSVTPTKNPEQLPDVTMQPSSLPQATPSIPTGSDIQDNDEVNNLTISYEPYDGVFDTARKVESTYGKTYTIASEKPLVYQYMPEYKENPPADGIYNENAVKLPSVETPSDEDTAFLNWNTEPDGSGDVLNPGDTIEVYKDIHLYAQYDRTRVETRLWDLSGNFKNYEFLGWYTKPVGGEKITAPYTYDCTKNTVFYAHWQKIDQEPQETASSTITSSPKPSLTPTPSYPEITPTIPPTEEPTVTPSIPPTAPPTETPLCTITMPPREEPIPPTDVPTAPPTETPLCTITMPPTEEPTPPTEEPTVTPTVPPAVVPEAPIVTEEPKAPSDTMAPDVSTISNGVIIEENNEEMEDADDRKEETFEKGDYLIVGNLKFKVVKIKGKKGELAFAGVKSKKVSTIVIPSKISKGDISFTITAIAKNAFKGCKKVSEVKIKTVNIKRIQKKALNGLNKKAKIRVPKSVLKAYKKMLKKSKYNVYKW